MSNKAPKSASSLFIAGALALLAGCAPTPSVRPTDAWVESTLRRLTLEEKIGQMIMPRAYGYYYSSEGDEFRRLVHIVRERKFGGVAFFQGDVLETAEMVDRLQQMAGIPLLIAGDFEWGAAMRIRRASRFPEAMALGATRDSALVAAIGKATGEEADAIGVKLVFAPVADVNVNPDNPVINTRSFGESPLLVGTLSTAFARGLQSAGVLATAKHFPGHGDTQTDSHLNLPLLRETRARLDSVELTPFRELVSSGVASVMVGHLEVPSLQKGGSLPATLSPGVINGVLRSELKFSGLVITDALDMGALVNTYGQDSIAVKAVQAGADILLMPADEDAAAASLLNAVKSGKIPAERIDQSVRKILLAKSSLGLHDAHRAANIAEISSRVATPSHLALARLAARHSITLLKGDDLLPLQRTGVKKILCAIVADIENYRTEINRPSSPWTNEPVGDYFVAQMRKRSFSVQSVRIDPTTSDLEALLAAARRADIIVCPLFSKARSGSGAMGIPPKTAAAVDTLLSLDKPVILIAMGSPYVLANFDGAQAMMCTYSDGELSTESAVEALFGEIPTTGKLPVTIPDMFPYGSGIELGQSVLRKDSPESAGMSRDGFARVDSVIVSAIGDSAFPGAQVAVVKSGTLVYAKSYGSLEYGGRPVDNSTLYDIASMTKVFATTPSIMYLYDQGKISLDDRVTKFIPEFGNHGKENISIRNLLAHDAGLPPFKLLYRTCKSPQEILDSVYQTEMIYRTGDSTVYSDFDFILLGKIVERITGKALDRFADSVFFTPLGMAHTLFNPATALIDNVAPTELDTSFRRQMVRGVVHDENAFALGGVSGHAGLFSTASDLAILMDMIMNGGRYAGRQYLKPETVALFTKRQGRGVRALGWDMKAATGYSSAGTLMSEKTFGHTGFTGTSVWADPTKDIFVIFLTNRVHPTRANNKIAKVRPALYDAVMRAGLPAAH